MQLIKKRFDWLDYLKGFCMISIIICHVNPLPGYYNYLFQWYLVGFFFAAGFTFKATDPFIGFLKKKFQYLVIPVLCFGIINLLLALFTKDFNIAERLRGILFQLPGHYDDMWFVACLFTMELLFYPISRYIRNDLIACSVCVFMLIVGIILKSTVGHPLPWHIINACLLLVFVEFGYIANKKNLLAKIKNNLSKPRFFTFTILLLVAYVLIATLLQDNVIDLHLLRYGNMPIFYFFAFFGTFVLSVICICIEQIECHKIFVPIKYIGINSLIYYGLQSKTISIFLIVFPTGLIDTDKYLQPIISAIIISLVLAPMAYIVRNYFPFIIGRPLKKYA